MEWWKLTLMLTIAIIVTAGVGATIAGAWLLCGASLAVAQGVFWGSVTTLVLAGLARGTND